MLNNFISLLNQGNSFYTLVTITIASLITYAIIKIKNSTQDYKNIKGGKFLVMIVNSSFVSLIILVWLNLFVDRNNILLQFLGKPILDIIMKVKSISTTWLLWLCLSRLVQQLESAISNNEVLGFISDKSLVKFISKILKTVIYVIMVSLVMNVLGLDFNKIFTLLGGSAVLIGFAAKNIIERSLAGIFIKVSRKFNVGDQISLPDKHISGKVVEIGMTSTKILMVDLQTITIPNEVFNANTLINVSNVPYRCVSFDIKIPSKYSTKIQDVIQQIKNNFDKLDTVQSASILCSNVSDFINGDWGVVISFRVFVKTKDLVVAANIKNQLILKSTNIINQMLYLNKD